MSKAYYSIYYINPIIMFNALYTSNYILHTSDFLKYNVFLACEGRDLKPDKDL
jgi:hypothetical protein